MKTASVNKNEIFGASYRFDPSYHLSEGIEIRRKYTHIPYGLSSVSKVTSRIFYGLRANRVYVTKRDHAIPFLTGASIMQADLNNTKLVSKKYSPAIDEMTIQKGWVMITRSGTVGQTAFSNKLHEGKYGSEDIIRVVPNDSIKPGVLYAYLASKYGHCLLTQGSFGAVIQHIEPDFIGNLPIPNFPASFQQEVDDLIQQSAKLREQAANALEEAKKNVSSFINVHFDKEHYKTAKVSSKDILNSLQYRLDPPALIFDGVKTMEEVTNRVPFKKVGDLNAKVYRPGIFKRIYVANGIPYIKGSEIFLTNPFRRCEQLSRSRTPFIDEMTLREGQILMTCAGSVGDVKMITKEYEDKKAIGSQDIIRIESYDELYTREYLFVYFQVPFVYDYIQSMKYGSVIERIEPFHVESIPVIKPSKELSDEVTAIIKTYMDYTYRAFNAEEKAITMVEEEIEKWQSPTA
ncbi:MAG: restriction endonuclease subunit S [Bacilli bacterium]|nr:restriction endonuclease subunit S [Bacilli bacterium]